MKQLKKVLCLFVFVLLFFAFSGIAFASVNIEIISAPDIDTAIENREVPFSDSPGNNLLCGIQGGGTGPSYFTPWSVIQPYLY